MASWYGICYVSRNGESSPATKEPTMSKTKTTPPEKRTDGFATEALTSAPEAPAAATMPEPVIFKSGRDMETGKVYSLAGSIFYGWEAEGLSSGSAAGYPNFAGKRNDPVSVQIQPEANGSAAVGVFCFVQNTRAQRKVHVYPAGSVTVGVHKNALAALTKAAGTDARLVPLLAICREVGKGMPR